ncbi:MAG: beta-lactamase family protein [Solirubrobacterales bacterium]|nr:beta-lactamase family protein [Solirubrobacterales bacterium]
MTQASRAQVGKSVPILLAVFAFLAVSFAAPKAEASTQSNLNRALNRIMDVPNGPPGISMQIVKNGKSQYYRRGLSNVKSGQKPFLRQRFRIASVAKAFSGAVALNLVAQGRLSLDSTIGEILPGMLPKASHVTLGQALHHTGGLPEYIKSKGFLREVGTNPGAFVSPNHILSWVRNTPLTHKPGTTYEYSDTDNIVVGLMAQRVTGVRYIWQIRALGRKIGGLPATFLPRTVTMPGPHMRGYDITPGKAPEDVSNLINPSGAWASGGIVSTLPNLSRFFRAYVAGRFFGNQRASLKRAQRQWVKGESQPAGPGNNWAGMGLFRYVTKCGVVYGHTGSFPGYRVFAASSADGKRSVAFVANAQILAHTKGNPNAKKISTRIRNAQVAAVCHALK